MFASYTGGLASFFTYYNPNTLKPSGYDRVNWPAFSLGQQEKVFNLTATNDIDDYLQYAWDPLSGTPA